MKNKKEKDYRLNDLPMSLLKYLLKPNNEGKASRLEALNYLVMKQKLLLDIHFEGGSKTSFRLSVLRISKQWNWNRRTVKSFLLDLQSMGIIELERNQYGFYVRVLNITQKEENIGENTT